jgi:NAD(P)-dependent dehydrogenase (short-subunit alcohol dehydrogenase family)
MSGFREGLSDRVAVVTGGASGIGAACAEALAAAGASVAVIDVDGRGADMTAARLRATHGVTAVSRRADVTHPALVDAALAAVVDELGPVDVAIHSAGGLAGSPSNDIFATDLDDFDAVVRLNLRGTFVVCRAVAGAMRTASTTSARTSGEPAGAIVVITSVQGILGSPHLAAYGAAKAGMNQLVRTLALELAPDGIRVNAIAPSIVDTPSVAALVTPERRRASEESIPLGRIGRPEDVAGLAVTLVSPLGAYVTGQTLVVDGGLSLTTARPTRADERRASEPR